MVLVGQHTPLLRALGIIAHNCDRANLPSHVIHDRCRAHYPNLIPTSQADEGTAP